MSDDPLFMVTTFAIIYKLKKNWSCYCTYNIILFDETNNTICCIFVIVIQFLLENKGHLSYISGVFSLIMSGLESIVHSANYLLFWMWAGAVATLSSCT
jgi:hypothetical protein